MDSRIITAAEAAGKRHGLDPKALAAVVAVESNGVVFATVNGRQEPLILPEPHIFDRRLAGEKRGKARAQGLAHPTWGAIKYDRTQAARWDRLNRMRAIDNDAALESASWGVGQVMGFHWKFLGFASVEQFVASARSGLEGQIDVMARFIVKNGLADELNRRDWSGFARGYNGPGYKKNRYHIKMADAYKSLGGNGPSVIPFGMLRLGASGARVRELQALLVRAGHPVKVDGDFGPATRDAVSAFQAARNLTSDGVAGPQTMAALDAYRQGHGETPGIIPATEDPQVIKGAVFAFAAPTALQTVQGSIDQALATGGTALPETVVTALTIASVALGLAGAAFTVWALVRRGKTEEGGEDIWGHE